MANKNAKYEEWLTEEGLLKIEGWARDGATDEILAEFMGISRSTLSEWKKKFPKISDTLKKGKDIVDRQVENALLKNALGYEYEEVNTFITQDENGNTQKKIQKVKRYQRPDTTAQIFWLKNRKPTDWREKQNIEFNTDVAESEKTIEKILEEFENEQKKAKSV